MSAASCSSLKRTKLLSIIIVASLIGPVRLKDFHPQERVDKDENNASMIIISKSLELDNPNQVVRSLAEMSVTNALKQDDRSRVSHILEKSPRHINSKSSVSNSTGSREELDLEHAAFIEQPYEQQQLQGRSLKSNCRQNSSAYESHVQTEVALTPTREDEDREKRKGETRKEFRALEASAYREPTDTLKLLEKPQSFVQITSARSRIYPQLENGLSGASKMRTSTTQTGVGPLRCMDQEEHRHQPNLPQAKTTPPAPLTTLKREQTPPDGMTVSPVASGEGSKATGSHIKSRTSRATGQEHEELAAALTSMNSIQAIVGHQLTIPCANQTLDLAPSSSTSSAPLNGQQRGRQPKGSGQRRAWGGSQAAAAKVVANGQRISLIVWHKDDQMNSPIFSVDARGAASLRDAKQQTGLDSLKGRAHLQESTRLDSRGQGSGPALVIDEAGPEDGGVYTCTVEFHEEPTQTHQMQVLLINPPRNLIIQDHVQQSSRKSHLRHQQQTLMGPYDEESRLELTCEAEQGEPAGQVSWWQLVSVSNLPLTALGNQRLPQATLPKAPESPAETDSNRLAPDSFTTLSFDANANGKGNFLEGVGGQVSGRVVDYFVALHSGPSVASLSVVRELPFMGDTSSAQHARLRHWTRVGSQQQTAGTKIRAVMEIPNLSRANLGNEFICLARNNDLSPPVNGSVKLDLNLKPTEVRIMHKANYVLKMGQKITIECHVYGSRPSARVRWLRGPTELEASVNSNGNRIRGQSDEQQSYISELDRDIYSNNLTKVSYLTIVPQLSDNQQSLTCSASNPKMPNVPPLSDSLTMNVFFPAQMTLQFGASIKQDQLCLGNDVFMDCVIRSNPPIDDLTWLFNSQPLTPNASAGIIMSNLTLVIQGIRIEHRGKYQCVGQNSMGKFHSNKLELKPKFKPVCDYSLTKTKYKVAVNQSVKIECNVLAEPSDGIHFVWQFNQSYGDPEMNGDTVVRPLEDIKQYETNFTKSYVTFTPKARRNYGLFCSASNSIDKQESPCAIQVIASELPEPVFSCFFDTLTNTSFNVHCQRSVQSSSSRQTYLLELYTNESSSSTQDSLTYGQQDIDSYGSQPTTHLKQRQEDQDALDDERALADDRQSQPQQVRKLRSDDPSFQVTDLKPDTSYNVMIYVENSKGRSVPYFHPVSTLAADPLASLSGNGGQIQFSNNKRPPPSEPLSLSDRLISYLKVSDYLIADGTRPLLGVALIVLLCTLTVVTVTFFVIRICRSPPNTVNSRSRDRAGRRKRAKLCSGSGILANGDDIDKLRTYNGKEAQLDTNVQLNLATPSRLKALAGSGSDTSRETNTDSTLISLFRPGPHEPVSTPTDGQQQEGISRRPSYGSIQRQGRSETSQSYRVTGTDLRSSAMADILHQAQQQQRIHSAYSTIKRPVHSPRDFQQQQQPQDHISTTPQISIQSGSDCTVTNSNNELQGDEFHDQLLIKCQDSGLDEPPVYVIGRDGQLRGLTGQSQAQLRILNHPPVGSWANYSGDQMGSLAGRNKQNNNGSVSGGTQVSSSATADSFEQQTPTTANSSTGAVFNTNTNCQPLSEPLGPVGGAFEHHELPLPISLLPNSVSIPVSLAAGECSHLAVDNYHHRRLSHEFLAGQELCLTSAPTGPYLTLAPATSTNQTLRYQGRSYGYPQEQQQPRIVPYPGGFGSIQQQDQLVAALTDLTPPDETDYYRCGESPQTLSVMADNLIQYRDDTYRRSRAQAGTQKPMPNVRRATAGNESHRLSMDDGGQNLSDRESDANYTVG